MNPTSFFLTPGLLILIQWTGLLALGWVAQWLLRQGHARWRLILWRSILCFGVVLPLAHFFSFPKIEIRLSDQTAFSAGPAETLSPASPQSPIFPAVEAIPSPAGSVVASAIPNRVHPVPSQPRQTSIPWTGLLMAIWLAGCGTGAFRLFRLQLQLGHLRRTAAAPEITLQQMARETQARLKVQRPVGIRVSDSINSPFVCGLFQPAILLPRTLAEKLPLAEILALLNHEIAHLRQHDLFWCAGWQWMKVVCWFHPLAWNIPAAHNLACEQEADRIASGQLQDRSFYPQLLARLVLRVMALPKVETELTLNGTSQIAQRLSHLQRDKVRTWKWPHSLAAFGLAGTLLLVAGGWKFSKVNAAAAKLSAPITFKEVIVTAQDEAGKPVAGARIKPDGLRVRGPRRVDHYGWNTNTYGPRITVTTDREGQARVRYPVEAFPAEKLETGEISFSVTHPDFVTTRPTEYSVDGREKPIRLTRGISLEVSGYFGSDRQSVTELVPYVSQEGLHSEDWQKKGNGTLETHRIAPGGHLIQLMGRLASGEIVYSEALAFTAEKGKPCNFNLELKPGIRLEGRVDDQAPRPIKNGRVIISVRPKEIPAWLVPEDMDPVWKEYGYVHLWQTYRPIAEDGTFVFESIPSGEVDVIVQGDGFVSANGGEPKNRIDSKLVSGLLIGVPQPFPLAAPVTSIEVRTEPTATLEITAKTKSGRPIEGATVFANPNVLRIGGVFGWTRPSSEEPFRTVPPLAKVSYSATTDKNGFAVIRNLPAVNRGVDIEHPAFEVALDGTKGLVDRRVRTQSSPGTTNRITVILQPKGKQFIGNIK